MMTPMEHEEALRLQAAEKYLLGELPPDMREAYEEHYFTCAECANDIKAGASFVGGLGKIFGDEKSSADEGRAAVKTAGRGWYGWLRPAFALPALLLVLAVVGYQNIVLIPGLKLSREQSSLPYAVRSFHLIPQDSRAEVKTTIHVGPREPFNLALDLLPNDFRSYRIELLNEAGAVLYSLHTAGPQPKNILEVSVPAGYLRPGRYEMVAFGESTNAAGAHSGQVLSSCVFSLEIGQ
jgi:hypothetical protein